MNKHVTPIAHTKIHSISKLYSAYIYDNETILKNL